LAHDVGLAQARNVERLTNSALMLNPAYQEGIRKYVEGIGKKDKDKQ
jgi:enoyl-CoA hydratase